MQKFLLKKNKKDITNFDANFVGYCGVISKLKNHRIKLLIKEEYFGLALLDNKFIGVVEYDKGGDVWFLRDGVVNIKAGKINHELFEKVIKK